VTEASFFYDLNAIAEEVMRQGGKGTRCLQGILPLRQPMRKEELHKSMARVYESKNREGRRRG
jgi:hypothetical protein